MKKKIILIIIFLVLAIIFLLLAHSGDGNNNEIPNNSLSEEKGEDLPFQSPSEPEEQGELEEDPLGPREAEIDLSQNPALLARLFIERYGSYSTDTSPDYLEELLPWLSQSFRTEIESRIQNISQNPPSQFYGQTVKIISFSQEMIEQNKAQFKAQVQLEKTKGQAKEISYQEVDLTLIQENGQWKVDSCSL